MAISWRDIGILSDAADLDDYEDDYNDPDKNPDDDWSCAFGAKCLMSSFYHQRSECYTVEMVEAWADEAAQDS